MPKPCFHIGDFVWCRHGFGYIMGMQHIRNYNMAWYMIGISVHPNITPDAGITHVVYDTEPTRFKTVTEHSLSLVQDHALQFVKPVTDLNKYEWQLHVGDIVRNKTYGHGIILTGGYIRPERKGSTVYYHVYYFESDVFDYDCLTNNKNGINNMILCDNHTPESRNLARRIIQECYLEPIFSADKNHEISHFISAMHMDFSKLPTKG